MTKTHLILRRKYIKKHLDLAKENAELIQQYSVPPQDIMDYGNVEEIQHHIVRVKGNEELQLKIVIITGNKISCSLKDSKVDAPLQLAQYVQESKTLKYKDKALKVWSSQTIKQADKILLLSKKMSQRLGISIVNNANSRWEPPSSGYLRTIVKCHRSVTSGMKKGKPGTGKSTQWVNSSMACESPGLLKRL